MKVINYEVVRSYSKTIQEEPYSPANYFASYKAVIKEGATKEEIQAISDDLAERSEEDVMGKIDPQKVISRRASMAELRTKLSAQEKRIIELETQVNNIKAF